MATRPPSYFTTTLGEAAVWNEKHPHKIRTINGLLDFLGRQESGTKGSLAAGFPHAHGSATTFTFAELNASVAAAATLIANKFAVNVQNGSATQAQGNGTIGLISRSSPNFLFAWLGAMRSGYAVLLLA
jgi:acyl-CoA synthetase (AMP-forming)/AMP-acid ligase II